MHCTNCGAETKEGTKFCKSCGTPVGLTPVPRATVVEATPNVPTSDKSAATIKCGNCDYIGEGQHARKLIFTILAWMCVVFAPLITIIYFVGTKKWRCPKCKSTFLGVKNKEGVFVAQGSTNALGIFLIILVGIAIIGILSSVVLASLNTAREKGLEAQGLDWATLTSADGKLTVELPRNPEYDLYDTSDNVYGYSYVASEKDGSVSYIVKYEDFSAVAAQENVDLTNADSDTQNAFLKALADGTVEEYKLIDFSSQFISSQQHNAVKFNGDIIVDGDTLHMEGVIILVGEAAYYVVVLTEQGYTSQFERVVASLQIN